MKSASRLTMLVAGIVFVLALAQLKYVASATLWDLSRREAVILTILGVAVCALVSASLYVDAPVLPLIATFAAFYIWGQVFYDGESRYAGFELGYWVPTVAAVVMSLSGVVAVMERRRKGLQGGAG